MKITVEKKELMNAIKDNMKAITGSKTTIPMFENILFETNEDGLKITTCDQHNVVIKKIKNENIKLDEKGNGLAVLPAKTFNKVIKNLKDWITLETGENNQLKIYDEKSKFSFSVANPENYPMIPDTENLYEFIAPGKEFFHLYETVQSKRSKNETRPILSGVLTEFNGEVFKVSATDSHCLAQNTMPLTSKTKKEENMRLIVNGRGLDIMQKIKFAESDANVSYTEKYMKVSDENTIILIELLEGNYPDIERIIPQNFNTEVAYKVADIEQVCKNAKLILEKDTCQMVKIEVEEHQTTVSATNNGKDKTSMQFDENRKGEDLTIHANPEYILNALDHFENDVSIKFISPVRPFLLVEEDNNLIQLITPIRVA